MKLKTSLGWLLAALLLAAGCGSTQPTREALIEEMLEMNRRVAKKAPPPGTNRAIERVPLQTDKVLIDGQALPTNVVARVFSFLPEERVAGARYFRRGQAVFSNYALYLVGDNVLRILLGLERVAVPDEFFTREMIDYITGFYYMIPYAEIPRMRRVRAPSRLKLEGADNVRAMVLHIGLPGDEPFEVQDFDLENFFNDMQTVARLATNGVPPAAPRP
jgi:hypothetical protein